MVMTMKDFKTHERYEQLIHALHENGYSKDFDLDYVTWYEKPINDDMKFTLDISQDLMSVRFTIIGRDRNQMINHTQIYHHLDKVQDFNVFVREVEKIHKFTVNMIYGLKL
jgi:hypothetical protein